MAKKGANDTPPYGKDAGYYPYNGLTPTSPLPGGTPGPNYDAYMLGQTTPVVIGPGGKMYATDKQHTDFAVYQGYKGTGFNPYAYILVTANYSNMTQAQFAQTMTDKGLVLLENNGQPETFAQLPGSLLNVGSDPYRALQYEVIKNKYPNSTVATVVGSDKAAVPYFEFLVGDAYRKAGLHYATGADANYAAAWSLNANNFVDAKTSKLMPSFILPNSVTVSQNISDATLGTLGTAAIDNTGGLNGLVTMSGGKPDWSGLLIQTGNDLGGVVQLSGNNTYHGGTVILAGTLNITSDANLGDPSGALLFRSVTEGNGTLQAGADLTINRNIDIGSETATLDPAGHHVTINGVISGTQTLAIAPSANGSIVTLAGTNTTEGDISVNGKNGTVTLQISSDANLGNNNYTNDPHGWYVGALDLSKATLQTLGAISLQRTVNVTGASTIDPYGFSSSLGTLNLTDTSLTVKPSAAGSTVTSFNTSNVSGGATLTVNNATAGAGNTTTVQLGSLVRTPVIANYATPYNSTLTINYATGTGESVQLTNASAFTHNGIIDPWVVGQGNSGKYDFLTYNNGLTTATYTSTSLATSAAASIVNIGSNATVSNAAQAYALKLGGTLSGPGSLALGDGTNPAGLILNGGTISLAGPGGVNVGGSELIVTDSATNAINSKITGTNGLTVNGTGKLTLGAANNIGGSVSVNGGTLILGTTGAISSAMNGVNLGSSATLQLNASNTIAALNGAGTVVIGANTLTIGEAGTSAYSLTNATIGKSGDGGSLVIDGGVTVEATGGKLSYSGTTTVENGSTLRIKTTSMKGAGNVILADAGSTIMFDQGGGGNFGNLITGAGNLKLISGSMTLTNTGNNYTGGTNVFWGGVLYAATNTMPNTAGSKISNDGTLVIDQHFAGNWNGVISDMNRPGYGMVIIDDSYAAYNGDTTSGTANGQTPYQVQANNGAGNGNVTFMAQQAYTGATLVNYGTLTLGVQDAIKSSSGVQINPGAILTLGANNQIAALNSGTFATVPTGGAPIGGIVNLGGYTLKVGDSHNYSSAFSGVIQGNGNLETAGTGMLTLSGANTFTGTTAVDAGSTLVLTNGGSLVSPVTVLTGGNFLTSNGATLNNLTVGTGGQFQVAGSTNVQSYTGNPGSSVAFNVNLSGQGSTAGTLNITGSTSGSSAITLANTGTPGTYGTYNPNGVVLVNVSKGASGVSSSSFTLPGGPVRNGLFQYDIAYNPDPQFLLVSVPDAEAYRLATLPGAAQSLWHDTAKLWLDRQANLRDLAMGGAAVAGFKDGAAYVSLKDEPGERASPAIWAAAQGSWTDRSEQQTYRILNNSYAEQMSYNLRTTSVFSGADTGTTGVLSEGDKLMWGISGGHINSSQTFKDTATSVNYEGGSIGIGGTYFLGNLFADAQFKADFLRMTYNAPAIGASRVGGDANSVGAIADLGYRYKINGSFVEPVVGLAYVTSTLSSLALAGNQVSFNGSDNLRGRVGLRAGTTIVDNSQIRVMGSASASYWDNLAGNSSVTFNGGAVPLTLNDKQLQGYGQVGLNLNFQAPGTGWSGFVKGDYSFADRYNSGSVGAGIKLNF